MASDKVVSNYIVFVDKNYWIKEIYDFVLYSNVQLATYKQVQ